MIMLFSLSGILLSIPTVQAQSDTFGGGQPPTIEAPDFDFAEEEDNGPDHEMVNPLLTMEEILLEEIEDLSDIMLFVIFMLMLIIGMLGWIWWKTLGPFTQKNNN